jgi:hypothetical protein
VSFFDLPGPEPVREQRQPDWMGPPDNMLGAAVPLHLVLARTDQTAVAITGATAFPSGLLLQIAVRIRNQTDEMQRAMFHGSPFHPPRHLGDRTEGVPPEVLRLGVQFSDGRKATSLGMPAWSEQPPTEPLLWPHGGSGGERSGMTFWLWPLPPEGPLLFACEWPLAHIPFSTKEVDAAVVLDAAGRAETLWPSDGGTVAGGGFTGSTQIRFAAGEQDPPKG